MGHGIWNEEALEPQEKKPFVPYAVVGSISHYVRKVLDERGDFRLCSYIDESEPSWVPCRSTTKIKNPDEALDILLDVTGQKSMVEKIKILIRERRDDDTRRRERIKPTRTSFGDGRISAYRDILGCINSLQAGAKKGEQE